MRGWGGKLSDNLIYLDEAGSTNDELRGRVRSGDAWEGVVVMAERQTAGRGRKGASWICEPGKGLAFSVLLKPAWPVDRWGWVSLAAGLAIAETVEGFGMEPALKWPNDVLLAGRKFCGILTEASGGEVIVGIGINVGGREEEFPEEVEATTLSAVLGREVPRELVLERAWTSLGQMLQRSTGEVAERVWERLAWRDQQVVVRHEGFEETGMIRAFGPCGELVVETSRGLRQVSDVSSLRLART